MRKLSTRGNKRCGKRGGFTLAEVLITLAIIGVVAALTIPNLMAKNAKLEQVTGLKKAYSTTQQAFKLIMADEGVSQFGDTSLFNGADSSDAARNDQIDTTIKKYFKTIKTCKDGDTSCKIDGYTYLGGGVILGVSGEPFGRNGHKIYTSDGMAITFALSQSCEPNYTIPGKMKASCGALYVDINGPKSPNKPGRDYFTYIIGYDGSLFPKRGIDYMKNFLESENYEGTGQYWKDDTVYCGTLGSTDITGAFGDGCTARIMEEGWQMNY